MGEARLVVDARNKLGEGAVWDPVEQALWWVDIELGRLQRHDPARGESRVWQLPERIGCFALRERGGLVCALERGFAFFDPESGAVDWIVKPDPDRRNRMNDGKCDRAGRLWAGGMDETQQNRCASLWRLDPDRSVHRMATGIGISNGISWSPDDRTMYFADTQDRTIYSYDFDAASGAIANRRVLTDHAEQPGGPDGSTVDAEGYIWNAQWGGWRLVRWSPEGRVDRVVELPVEKPTSCTFGGPDLATLYVTSAIWDLEGEALAAQPWAGGVLAIEPGVRGLPEPRFKG
ncbi:MAG TPA: SMP-30/gluconolactonase/LRE family protein [Geminicoccaceae bacterium]|nr:SMP-30/gluconolactonase/LRE family protein [Geminicoccaceae bacterium]